MILPSNEFAASSKRNLPPQVSRAGACIAVALLLSLVSACTEEPPTIRLLIDSSRPVPGELDGLRVRIAASSPAGRVCAPVTGLIDLATPDSLPAPVDLVRGDVYTAAARWEVIGTHRLAAVTSPILGWSAWPESGTTEIAISLDPCFDLDCVEGESCDAGSCEPVETPAEFDDPGAVDEAVDCWATE